eukprot:467221-Prorocentrum_minimum.AAC.1
MSAPLSPGAAWVGAGLRRPGVRGGGPAGGERSADGAPGGQRHHAAARRLEGGERAGWGLRNPPLAT